MTDPELFFENNNEMNSDLETRKKTREQAWKVDGWAETVYNTGTQLLTSTNHFLMTDPSHTKTSSNPVFFYFARLIVRLIENMEANILLPMDFSSLK